MEIRNIILCLCAVFLLASCDRDLDLEHEYDNTESSKQYEADPDEETPDTDADPDEDSAGLQYTEIGDYRISERVLCEKAANASRALYMLDGKVSVFRKSGEDTFTTVWSQSCSMWQDGCATPWLEDNLPLLDESETAFLGSGVTASQDGFTDGGMWTIGVHQLDDSKFVAFFHAESHFSEANCQYKSIGVSYSEDGGVTWDAGTKIISGDEPKPEVGEGNGKSYGLGDGCVLWNEDRQQWICYYSGYCDDPSDFVISMAASSDPEGEPGTWKKWDGSDFTLEACDQTTGLGDKNYAIAGLKSYHGGNPSVTWNTAISRWIMVYHSWTHNIIMSTSEDGIVWDSPIVLISNDDEPGGAMYPNLIGEDGDLTSGDTFRIYYSADMDSYGIRDVVYRIIKIK